MLLLIADNSKSNDIAEKCFFFSFSFFSSFFTLLVSKHRIYRYIYYGFRNLTSTCFHLYFRSLSHLAYIFILIYQKEREKCMHRTIVGIVKEPTIRKLNKTTANWIYCKLLSKLIVTTIATNRTQRIEHREYYIQRYFLLVTTFDGKNSHRSICFIQNGDH